VAALLLALPAGCTEAPGVASATRAASAPVVAAPAAAARPLPASHPTGLRIPAIGVDASDIADLRLRGDGSMQVPPDATTVGWYTDSPTPGERGPAVLAAHVDWDHRLGVFHDLHQLRPGDLVAVDRADGSTARFRVRRVARYPKDHFPTREVYGNVPGAELRLITCGGELDRAARSYRDNIVVYARLTR
jgi:sortase (surface protein transpeptidase)